MDFGIIVDLETTGVDFEQDEIIEIGIIEFGIESDRPPSITRMYSALEEASKPLDPAITKITGLDDQILNAQKIDWNYVRELFDKSSLYIAHNAKFDKAFLERKLISENWQWPGSWACSMQHIDWETLGFKTKSLNYLAADHGFVNPFAHRALFDCAATFRLILPYFDQLVYRSSLLAYRILASSAPFEKKDVLKANKYRWNPDERVWFKEILEDRLEAERTFLSEQVYEGKARHEEQQVELV